MATTLSSNARPIAPIRIRRRLLVLLLLPLLRRMLLPLSAMLPTSRPFVQAVTTQGHHPLPRPEYPQRPQTRKRLSNILHASTAPKTPTRRLPPLPQKNSLPHLPLPVHPPRLLHRQPRYLINNHYPTLQQMPIIPAVAEKRMLLPTR